MDLKDVCLEMSIRFANEKKRFMLWFYFRKPDKLRIRIHPYQGLPDNIISWYKEENHIKVEEEDKIKVKEISKRLHAAYFFLKNITKGSYFYKNSNSVGLSKFVLSFANSKNEKFDMFISKTNFTLKKISFDSKFLYLQFLRYKKYDSNVYLPKYCHIYQNRKLLVKINFLSFRINSLQNQDSFFFNLKEKPQLKRSVREEKEYKRLNEMKVRRLISMVGNKYTRIRVSSIRALSLMGEKAESATPMLIVALQDEKEIVRKTAAYALGKISPKNNKVISALIGVLKDKSLNVRNEAKKSLIKSGQKSLPLLTKVFYTQNQTTKILILEILEQSTMKTNSKILFLYKVLQMDKNKKIQSIAKKIYYKIHQTK